MKNILRTIIFFSLLASCSSDTDFEFTSRHRTLLNKYSVNDTIYFKSLRGDLDTFFVAKIDSLHFGGIMAESTKKIFVEIQHLPINHWNGGTQSNQNGGSTILNQELITIEKCLDRKPEDQYFIGISFRDFEGKIENLDSITSDTLLADIGVNQYWQIKNDLKNQNNNSISKTIWTEKHGLTAYYKKNDDFYKIQLK